MNRLSAVVAALLACCLAGCSDLRYLARAAYEEARILARREPIEELLRGDLEPEARQKLELTLAARQFAADALDLDVGGSYSSVAEVGEEQVIHVVSAARRDRLEAYRWWFPIVGSVPYRGYFHLETAQALARELDAEGFDTYVRRALAFSTLGYFDDPLLSHLLRRDRVDLVDTILHELLHSTFYASGKAAFNESFANFVGHRGAIAFFEQRDDAAAAALARDRWADALQFADLLAGIIDELEAAYRRGVDEAERQALFAEAQRRYRDRSWRTEEYDRFETGSLNNAILLARRVYFERLDLFQALLDRYRGDLRACIAWVAHSAATAEDPYLEIERALAVAQSGLDGFEPGDAVAHRQREDGGGEHRDRGQ